MEQLSQALHAVVADPPPTAIDLDQLIAGERRRARNHLRIGAATGAAVLVAGAATVFFGAERYFWLGVALCGIGLALPTTIAVALLVFPRMALAGNAKLLDQYQLTFSRDGIRFQTTSIDSKLAWSLYTRATEVRDFYLLYWGRRQFTVVPKRAFESAADMQAFEALLADGTWDVLLLVLHGGVNRAILSHALTGDRIFLGGFEQSPGCINVLDVGADGRWIVRAVNHTPYDPAHVSAPRLTTMEQLWQEYLDSRDRNP